MNARAVSWKPSYEHADNRTGRVPADRRVAHSHPSGVALFWGRDAPPCGVFRTGASDISETIHSRASAIAVVAPVVLALSYSIIEAQSPRSIAVRDPIAAGLAVTAAALALISPVFHHTRWTGVTQRALWLALFAWLLRATRSKTLGGE
ncbi:MAG: hypothetical protein M3391_07010 [Actinomycetota bacterium]|nr:hypothetical protein [Actinomycetota bacterium]